ncbi:unnamed protein product [Ixodes pacificus]
MFVNRCHPDRVQRHRHKHPPSTGPRVLATTTAHPPTQHSSPASVGPFRGAHRGGRVTRQGPHFLFHRLLYNRFPRSAVRPPLKLKSPPSSARAARIAGGEKASPARGVTNARRNPPPMAACRRFHDPFSSKGGLRRSPTTDSGQSGAARKQRSNSTKQNKPGHVKSIQRFDWPL